jgi:DNA-binding NtrC family response regulator
MCPVESSRVFELLFASREPDWLGFYSGLFTSDEYHVRCVTTLAEATRGLERDAFHLLITDLAFGDASHLAIDVARRRGIPVIVISHDLAGLFHEPYANLYFEPPVSPKALLAVVAELVSSDSHISETHVPADRTKTAAA